MIIETRASGRRLLRFWLFSFVLLALQQLQLSHPLHSSCILPPPSPGPPTNLLTLPHPHPPPPPPHQILAAGADTFLQSDLQAILFYLSAYSEAIHGKRLHLSKSRQVSNLGIPSLPPSLPHPSPTPRPKKSPLYPSPSPHEDEEEAEQE